MSEPSGASQRAPAASNQVPAAGGVLSGRPADPWAAEEVAEQTARSAPTARPADAAVTTGRDTAYEQARAHAQGQARATQEALAQARAQARAAAGQAADDDAQAQAKSLPLPDVPPRRELRPVPPHTGLRIGPLHVGQIVVWQAAIAALVLAHRQPLPVVIPVAVVSLVALALTIIRVRERWLYEWAGLALRFGARRRSAILSAEDGSGFLSVVTRGGRLETIEIDEQEIALISHSMGFTAVLEVIKPMEHGQITGVAALPPLSELMPAFDSDDPPVSVQVVVHTVPAPGLRGDDDAVAQSYRELTSGMVPAQRRTWIALQAMHTPDAFSTQDMRNSLINSVRRVERKLAKAGLQVDFLRRSDAIVEFYALADPAQADEDAQRRSHEQWTSWHSGSSVHVGFRIANWPNLADTDGAELIQSFAAVPASSITVGVTVRRGAVANDLEAAVRIVVPEGEPTERAVSSLVRIAQLAGAQVQRLDGEHAFGLAASVPLGGFAA